MSKPLISRRFFLALSGAAAAAPPPLLAGNGKAGPVGGTVYIEREGRRGPGLAGVAVSDGRNVVLTDSQGRFSLPADHAKARFVSVSIPGGWRTALHYRPIKAGTKDYSFGLTPWEASKPGRPHRFIQITDTEILNGIEDHHRRLADELKSLAAGEGAAFIVHTGDICYERGLRDHIKLINTEKMGVPVFYCIGNHDLVGYGPYGEALFEELYGPCWYSFNAGGTHYAVLPMPGGDRRPSYTCREAAEWLKNDLALLPKGTPVVCFEHDAWTFGDKFDYKGVDLNAHNLKAWVYGHWHYNNVRRQGGVLAITTAPPEKGGIDASASAYRIVRCEPDGGVATDLRYGYNPGSFAAHLAADGVCAATVYKAASRTVRFTADAAGRAVEGERLSDYAWRFRGLRPGERARFTARFLDGSSLTREALFPAQSPVAWQSHAGGSVFMCPPAGADGRVFVGTTDENLCGEGGVAAFDARTGKRLWRSPMPASVKNAIDVSGGLVFAQDTEGNLRAFRAKDGTLAWEEKFDVAPIRSIGGVTVAAGVLYAGASNWLTALEPRTGRRIWHGGGWWIGEGTPDRPCVDPGTGTLIMGGQWSGLYANDAKTGKRLWGRSDDGLRFRGSLPAFEGGRLWIASCGTLFCLETRTGKTAGRIPLGNRSCANGGRPLLAGDLIVLTTADTGMIAVDRKTKKIAWHLPTGPSLSMTAPYHHFPNQLIQGSPVRIDGRRCCCCAGDGHLYIVETQTGKCLEKIPFGAPFFGTPLAAGGKTVFAADLGGTVSAVRV